ncbi:MAG: PilZ domain-containing protein [Candidatus Acidiferrales bacterium]
MRLGIGGSKTFGAPRAEKRIPMEVGVKISGHMDLPGIETTFTENVSARGARVLSSRRWSPNDRLTISTLTGSFRAVARVAYCESVPSAGYAVGLEFIQPDGRWIVGNAF